MDKDTLYYHFANLGLVLIGILSIQSIFNPFILMILVPGTIIGFIVSWLMRSSRLQQVDIFIGMLSLAAVVIILGRLYSVAITFENLMKIFSVTLVWLTFFQSFGLKSGNSYAMMQFISACLLISSVGLALEQETYYIALLALYLFIFIFTMRLNLLCEKERKGSVIIGDQYEIMGLWQQVKVVAIMFSLILLVASFVYPFVPRFENLSLQNIPSTLLGLPEKIPLLNRLADMTIGEDEKMRKQKVVFDDVKKRETSGTDVDGELVKKKKEREKSQDEKKEEQEKKEIEMKFISKEFNRDIDILEMDSLKINSDRDEMPLDSQIKLEAELEFNDGSTVPATQLVDWSVTGTAKVNIDTRGNLVAKETGQIDVSASYMGVLSNELQIQITEPETEAKKRNWLYYLLMSLLWLLILALLCCFMWVFMRSRRLSELATENPREFIGKVYLALCRGFRLYGAPRFNYMAQREFSEVVNKGILSSKTKPMRFMTEGVLEASFSTHDISAHHAKKTLGLFHEVKDIVVAREKPREFLKKILFRVFILDVLMIPKTLL
ncbi:MAG: hypothetical protein KJ957_00490 [Candidatus Omnitrophica bacterium]|nr:hypothetical protein [Candidatus Omnitrophota bacterium]